MEVTPESIIGIFAVLGGTAMLLNRLGIGIISFGKRNNNSGNPTRKNLMSKETKIEFQTLRKENQLLQSKEMCKEIVGNLKEDVSEMKLDVKEQGRVLLAVAVATNAKLPPPPKLPPSIVEQG